MSQGRPSSKLPATAAARLLVAAFALAACAWLALAAARAGSSRLISDYAARTQTTAAADEAIRLTPSDPEAHYARASVLTELGDTPGAIRDYGRAIELRPSDYVLWLERGKLREQSNDAEGALADFREALRLAPFYAQPRWQLGNALLRAGRREEAFDELRRAASADPALFPNFVVTLWHASGGDARLVAEAARPSDARESLHLARFLAGRGAAVEAMRLYRAAGASPEAEAGRRALLEELLAAGRFREAYEVWAGGGSRADDGGTVAAPSTTTVSLNDGGFEDERVRTDDLGFAWRFWRAPSSSAPVKFSLDSAAPKQGTRSLRVEFGGDSPTAAPLVSQLVLVEPDSRYRLTFAARARDLTTGGPPFVRVAAAGAKGADERQLAASPALANADDWRRFDVDFTTGADTTAVRVSLLRQPCNTSPCPAFGLVWLDDFGLVKL